MYHCCEQNCSFVVDLSSLADVNDVRSDDLGSWKNIGVHTVYVSVTFRDDDSVEQIHVFSHGKPKVMRSSIYKVKKTTRKLN